MAEAILNRAGLGKFRAFSAGSQPKGEIHPYAIDLVRPIEIRITCSRSIMAEAILNRAGLGKAGSQPKGEIHPYAIDLLRNWSSIVIHEGLH